MHRHLREGILEAMRCLCITALILLAGAGTVLADGMIKYSTPQVRLYTDLDRDEAQRMIDEIAFFAEFIDGFFRTYGITSRKENPIRCRLFARNHDFEEYRRKRNVRHYVGAYFSPGDNCIIAPYERGMSTLRHECAHQIIRRYFNDPPPWIDEGLACYFGGVAFDGHHNAIDDCSDSSRLKQMRTLLKQERLLDWKRFFGYEDHAVWNDEIFRGVLDMGEFYTQSWGVVYFYLHADAEDAKALFTKFMKGMHTGRGRTKLILRDLPSRSGAFTDFFREDHERKLELYRTASKQGEAKQYKEALETLVLFLGHRPGNTAGERLAAEVTWEGGMYEESLAFWWKLAARDPGESLYQWKICRCLVETGLAKDDAGLLNQAVKIGKGAVKMTKSKNPHCYAALARAYHAQGKVREALGAIRNALRFKCPEREDYQRLEEQYSTELRNRP